MNYLFYNKICQEPDLQDVAEYLKSPINLLEDIQNKILESSLKDKTSMQYLDISLECENIINKYLPNLLNDYCALTLEYRNTAIIKEEKYKNKTIKYTAKTLLLNTLAKVSEEIKILNTRFNESSSRDFLVRNRLLANFGKKKELLSVEQETESQFINQFDYKHFEQSYKKTKNKAADKPVSTNTVSASNKIEKKVTSDNKSESTIDWMLVEMLLVIGLMATTICIALMIYPLAQRENMVNNSYNDITEMELGIKNFFINNDFSSISNEFLLEKNILPHHFTSENKITTPLSNDIVIDSYMVNQPNDAFTIALRDIPSSACKLLVDKALKDKKKILVNFAQLLDNNDFTIEQGCSLNSNNIQFIYQ